MASDFLMEIFVQHAFWSALKWHALLTAFDYVGKVVGSSTCTWCIYARCVQKLACNGQNFLLLGYCKKQ